MFGIKNITATEYIPLLHEAYVQVVK